MWVKAAEGDDVQAIAKVIRDAGFQTYSLNDMLESVKKQSNQIQGMLAAIGAVSMLVSAICIANTMMMSINERRKEIGVLKVLGSEMTDIMFMFMVEALLVGIAGGLFGMGLSFGMRELIPVLFSDMDVRSIIPVWLVVVGLGLLRHCGAAVRACSRNRRNAHFAVGGDPCGVIRSEKLTARYRTDGKRYSSRFVREIVSMPCNT